MPTVIDELIVKLGLDPSNFKKGQKEAVQSFKGTYEDAKKAAGSFENVGKSANEALGVMQNRLLAVGAALTSVGIGKFISETIKQDAATSRLAYTLDTNVRTLDKWRNAAYITGGSAEGMTGSIQGLVSQFQNFALTGESSVIPWFRALNVNIADTDTGKMRDFDAIMRDLANAFQKMDPAKAAAFGRAFGFDQGTINLLVKGGDELDRILKMSNSTLSPESAENARQIAEAWAKWEVAITGVGRALRDLLTPGILSLLTSQTGTFAELKKGEIISRDSLLGSVLYGTKFRGFGVASGAANSGAGSGAFSSSDDKEAFIRAEAAKRGISPDVAMAVARSEGFNDYVGDKGTSFGAYQLHYKNNIPGLSLGGLGDEFTKKTGKHASDPSTEREQIQFALDEAAKGGWGPWHGWKGSQWAGIDKSGGGGSSETKIGTINVHTQATDAQGIAASIGPAIQRNGIATQSQSGPQ
jgi:hypothetical protein